MFRRLWKDGESGECKACCSARAMAWAAANPERVREIKEKFKEINGERVRAMEAEKIRMARLKDPEKFKKREAGRYLANRAKYNKASSEWRKNNMAKSAAYVAARRAKKIKATPGWANQFFIEEAYDLARRRTEITGFEWHVDHVFPLQSKRVCGLHVDTNLQVIPAIENKRKGNHFAQT